jgi:predicted nucleotidyltransferase
MPDMLHPFVRDHLDEIRPVCERFHVKRLELFGSAAGDDFDSTCSDLDLLVEFEEMGAGHFDTYFGLLEALQDLFGRPVDLVVARSIRNPYFLQGIESSRTLLYAA